MKYLLLLTLCFAISCVDEDKAYTNLNVPPNWIHIGRGGTSTDIFKFEDNSKICYVVEGAHMDVAISCLNKIVQ